MEGITDSILGRKESDVKLEVEENVEICPKSEEDEQVITEAEPLAWRPPAPDHVHRQVQPPLLVTSYVDGRIFDLPEGWIVERRPRTSLKYLGKVEKFYYEPGTRRQFRSWKAAQQHVNELKLKQNDQEHEHKPVPLELGDEFEPGARSRFRRLKDVHKYLRARKRQQSNQQPPQPQPENNHEQASEQKQERTPILVHGEPQPKVSHENSAENSNDNHSRKLKQASVPKESNVKLEFEENVETCRKMEEHEQVITEAEPLSWMPPADHIHGQAQHPLLMPCYVDGQIFKLSEGWLVEQRPRTSLKYIGKVDKFYYEPGTKRQFRSWKAAQEHVNELKLKQNDQQPPRPQPENDHGQTSGQKHEHKPVTLELGDEFEPGAKSRFRRLKDVHKYLRARKRQQNVTIRDGELGLFEGINELELGTKKAKGTGSFQA
ncbi:hypothetical protein V6N13_006049 [Hibiscus sabdariffa]|uniref:MBD domain-containing protein n=1 Tax=Hibiscus sabdariffa TaxID=183260 RepID=A0ABR2ENX7_9ROSI